ncbi:polysaccharide pyruvyl transferase [Novosphingobium malaysiense]|uniref:Polysaccharide pyruvyl transferase n=1 Tax=Novosphingobium malaysiense TaxID=1348853 RepID=A0A0B1ZW73_9SPHN|nr:polysaccharide pyruvyl transferase [Novosphingobium malaysiense]
MKYSPNLGDGLLAECLEQALVEAGAASDTCSVDLAGRSAFATGGSSRSMQLRVLDTLPATVRHNAVRLPLAIQSRRLWRPHYRKALDGADCVVIGGGNLITDLDLNFPTKLALAVDEAARRDLPVFLYGCGVCSSWSQRGRSLLQQALSRKVIRRVFVRDERSREQWRQLVGPACDLDATVVRDPGLLAAECYRVPLRCRNVQAPLIGINVTSQLALRYHSEEPPSPLALDAWYLGLARTLVAKGCRISIFTNGSPEDRACALRLRPAFEAMGDRGTVRFPEPRTPADLTCVIASLNAVAAFRMHAVIAAYSCGVPFLALAWDPKLESFVHSVSRADWLCRPVRMSGEAAAEQLLDAMRHGLPEAQRRLTLFQARGDIAVLQNEIARAVS